MDAVSPNRYTQVPVNVAPDVPHYVNLALGEIGTDMALQILRLAGTSKLAQETAGEVADKLPRHVASPDLLALIRDGQGQETWLGARSSDGGPTDWAMHHIRHRLGLNERSINDLLFGLADANGRLTDLAIRASDGQFEDFVIDRLRTRILAGYTPPAPPAVPAAALRQYADTKYTPGAEIFPVHTDSTRAAGWGSSSMQGMDSRVGAMFAGKGAAYFPGGKGAEWAQHIAARMGAVPALLTVAGGTVPASGAVDVKASNVPVSANLKAYTGTLAGIPGKVAFRVGSDPGTYAFTRTTAGTAVQVPDGTPFIPDAASYRDAVTLLWMGKNNLGQTGADALVIKLTDTCFDWLAPLATRCLVLGHFVDGNTPADSLERRQIGAVNDAHRARYGRLFVDVSAYLTGNQVWTDTGITPTGQDLAAQAAGNKPPSLSSDNGHLNAAGYDAVTALLNTRLTELGWY